MIMFEVARDYYQYATLITGSTEVTRDTLTFSTFKHRALNDEHFEAVRAAVPHYMGVKIV